MNIKDLIAEVREHHRRATPGPWRTVRLDCGDCWGVEIVGPNGEHVTGETRITSEDRDVVVGYRTAAPLLADEVERLTTANEELRLTLAAEQGRAEGAPSEGWACGAGEVRWGKVAGGDENTYGSGMLVEQVWGAFVLRGWRWTCRQLHDRGSTLMVEGIAPTARAAMLAADKATP